MIAKIRNVFKSDLGQLFSRYTGSLFPEERDSPGSYAEYRYTSRSFLEKIRFFGKKSNFILVLFPFIS
jgi:hypothetical protein